MQEVIDEILARAALPDGATHKHLRERLLSVAELALLPPVSPLVDGLLYRSTLAQLSGPPGSYKTFLSTAMACSVALGRTFEGHAVPQGGPVVYVCAEGASGMRARVLAWCQMAAVDPAALAGRLLFLPEPLQLGAELDVREATEVATEVGALLVVLDTRARCTVGLEENSATDQGRAIEAAERIQRGSGAAVLTLHHSGRAGDHGRGSNAWDGAAWSDLRLTGADLQCEVHCAKHKDVPDSCRHHFRLVPHRVDHTLMPECDEQQRSTLVLVSHGRETTFENDLGVVSRVLGVLETCAGPEGLSPTRLVLLAREREVSRATVYRSLKVLVRQGAVRNVGPEKQPRYVPTGAYRSCSRP